MADKLQSSDRDDRLPYQDCVDMRVDPSHRLLVAIWSVEHRRLLAAFICADHGLVPSAVGALDVSAPKLRSVSDCTRPYRPD